MTGLEFDSGVRLIGDGPGYVDGSEDAVLDILRRASDRRTASDELAGHISDWPTRYHLSRRRANLLRPLQISPGMRVLDVGAGTGVMARYIAERGGSVVALEGTLSRARAAATRCEGLDAVEVVCGPLDAFDDPDGFDLVLCVGVLEYAGPDHPGFLRRLRGLTRPGGALALAIENQLGLKYILGYGEDHLGQPWVGIEGYPGEGAVRTFSRRGLSELLCDAGFDSQRWLFPFPDYKTPGVILSEAAYQLADQDIFVDALVRWPCDRQASEPIRVCDDRKAHRSFLSAGLGPEVANSFLVVAGGDGAEVAKLVDPDVTAWFYGAERSRTWMGSKVFSDGPRPEIRRRSVDGGTGPASDGWLRQVRPPGQPLVVGHTVEQLALAAFEVGAGAVAEVLTRWREHLRAREAPSDPTNDGDDHPFRDQTTVSLLPADHLDVDMTNFVVDEGGDLKYIDSEWVLPSGVDADMACLRALWWFAADVVARGVYHPWPRSTTVAELVQTLGQLCATAAGPSELDRLRRAEALLQAKVTGRPSEGCLQELLAISERSQTDPDIVTRLPFTELHRRLAAAEDRQRQLEAENAIWRSEREALLDQLAEEQGERANLLRRLHLQEDQRFAAEAQLESERAAVASARAERDELVAELAAGRLAAERWRALERWQVMRLYRLTKRLLRRH